MLSLGLLQAPNGLFGGARQQRRFELQAHGSTTAAQRQQLAALQLSGRRQRASRRASLRAAAQGVAGGAGAAAQPEAPGAAGSEAAAASAPANGGAAATASAAAAPVAAAAAAAAAAPAPEPQAEQPWISVSGLRKVAAAADANEATDLLLQELAPGSGRLSEAQARELLAACLERGNVALSQSIYRTMTAAGAGGGSASYDGPGSSGLGGGFWPAATIETATALVVGLAQALHTREAIAVITSVRNRGLPTAEDVHFGFVVDCPGAGAGKPLTVMQPQEGVKRVVDSYSRYEYEVFSGTATEASSESLVSNQGWVGALARRVGLLRAPAAGAVHTLMVQTPTGLQRTFRFSTATADLPAKVGDRVSLVCSPPDGPLFSQRRLISASPPGTKPGEAMALTNHTTGASTPLQRPVNPSTPAGLPSWLVPVTAVLVASDAATSLISPAMPYLAAGAVAATVATGVAANTIVLPRMKMLPERAVEVQATRQKLLKQHAALEARIRELVDGAVEDVRMLARMWQLQNKMAAVGGEGAYDARLDRVSAARTNLEQRLQKRVELVDAYARVINMIEIEVEMDTQVPVAEVQGIEEQIARLTEIEGLQDEWRVQAEAQDEVERLLRTQQA